MTKASKHFYKFCVPCKSNHMCILVLHITLSQIELFYRKPLFKKNTLLVIVPLPLKATHSSGLIKWDTIREVTTWCDERFKDCRIEKFSHRS